MGVSLHLHIDKEENQSKMLTYRSLFLIFGIAFLINNASCGWKGKIGIIHSNVKALVDASGPATVTNTLSVPVRCTYDLSLSSSSESQDLAAFNTKAVPTTLQTLTQCVLQSGVTCQTYSGPLVNLFVRDANGACTITTV